jgi:gas vesicle protein
MQQIITIGSLALGAISAACFLLMAYLYYRNEQIQKNRLKRAEADMSDMMLLFQTMRDVIRQQKELAREFNQTLDSKMGAVKQILSQSLEKNERLYEKQQALTQELEEAKSQVEALQRQMGYLRDAARHGNGTSAAAQLAALAEEVDRESGRGSRLASPPSPAQFRQHVMRNAEDSRQVSGSAYGKWTGVDLDSSLDSPLPAEEPEIEEETAPLGRPEAAREAIRSLLDLAQDPAPDSLNPAHAGSNGSSAALSPMQKRVLDYSEAGMGVADISRELGIGKGEVRLMLSLARQSRME